METKRNTTLDVVRGLSLLFLPSIHSALLYGRPAICRTFYGRLLAVIAEYAAAPIFLVILGTVTVIGERKRASAILTRSGRLLLDAHLLNLLKLVIPRVIGIMPDKMLKDYGIADDSRGLIQMYRTGDVLHLGAIANVVCGVVRNGDKYTAKSLVLSLLIICLSPVVWKIKLHSLLNGAPPNAFFPVFPWLSYPLSGLAIGSYLNQDNRSAYKSVLTAGAILFLSGIILAKIKHFNQKSNYYRLGPAATLKHISFTYIILAIFGLNQNKFQNNNFRGLLKFLSTNITRYYKIQWILIVWLMPIFKYGKNNVLKTAFAGLLNTYLAIRLTKYFNRLRKSRG